MTLKDDEREMAADAANTTLCVHCGVPFNQHRGGTPLEAPIIRRKCPPLVRSGVAEPFPRYPWDHSNDRVENQREAERLVNHYWRAVTVFQAPMPTAPGRFTDFQMGDSVEVAQEWAYGEDLHWFGGYEVVRVEGHAVVVVRELGRQAGWHDESRWSLARVRLRTFGPALPVGFQRGEDNGE